MRRELLAFLRVVAFDVDEKVPIGKGRQNLIQRGHQSNALAAKREGLAAVGGVAVADVERLECGERVLACHALAVGAAVERPVMKHRKAAIGGWMDIEL